MWACAAGSCVTPPPRWRRYNLVNAADNLKTFNDGYHIVHHQNSKLHWYGPPPAPSALDLALADCDGTPMSPACGCGAVRFRQRTRPLSGCLTLLCACACRTELPVRFMQTLDKHAREDALVFEVRPPPSTLPNARREPCSHPGRCGRDSGASWPPRCCRAASLRPSEAASPDVAARRAALQGLGFFDVGFLAMTGQLHKLADRYDVRGASLPGAPCTARPPRQPARGFSIDKVLVNEESF